MNIQENTIKQIEQINEDMVILNTKINYLKMEIQKRSQSFFMIPNDIEEKDLYSTISIAIKREKKKNEIEFHQNSPRELKNLILIIVFLGMPIVVLTNSLISQKMPWELILQNIISTTGLVILQVRSMKKAYRKDRNQELQYANAQQELDALDEMTNQLCKLQAKKMSYQEQIDSLYDQLITSLSLQTKSAERLYSDMNQYEEEVETNTFEHQGPVKTLGTQRNNKSNIR